MLHAWLCADACGFLCSWMSSLEEGGMCSCICVSLFCGGGNLGDFTGSDGFYRDLSESTCLFACVCPFIYRYK